MGTTNLESCRTPDDLWATIRGNKDQQWYAPAVEYWDRQEASYNGVLGGFGHVSELDVAGSRKFLQKAFARQLAEAASGKRALVAVDCGAGVGRVTEQLLLHHFSEVDLVEPSRHLLANAEERLRSSESASAIPAGHRLGQALCMGLQQFAPQRQRYDVIWIQWALLYLTDDDAVAFFQRCTAGLKSDGVIFVKENICSQEQGFIVDNDDKSLTRSHTYMQKLFRQASLQLLYSTQQRDFPQELFKVQMYALRPKEVLGS